MLGSAKTKLPSLLWLAEWKVPDPLIMISKLIGEGFSYKFNNLEDALDSLEAINV